MPLSKDAIGGLIFVVLGAAVALNSLSLGYNTIARIGPGVFPGVIGLLMLLIGASVFIRAIYNNKRQHDVVKFRVRPIFFITVSVAVFALALPILGLLLSLVLLIAGTRLASDKITIPGLIIQVAALTGATVLIFYYGLEIPVSLWPR